MRALIKDLLAEKKLTSSKVYLMKKAYAKKHKLSKIPLDSEILAHCTAGEKKNLRILITKPTRTISGVSVIAIMVPPASCPGNCSYCPQGEEAPKSYTGYEPAAMRARLNQFDAYKQVQNRLKQLKNIGHKTDKNELIIMGGTFPYLPWAVQRKFIKNAFEGFNGKRSKTLLEAQKINETAKNRVIGLTIETRPDYVFPEKFLDLGATRVELGVQTLSNKIFKKINRGHGVEEVAEATKRLKDNCFKILYHIMPGLPGSNFESDSRMFKKLFSDERFKPDMLKIYPCLVIKGTRLYEEWEDGEFKAVDEAYMTKLLKEIYKIVPKWLRIMRVQRDIPARFIEAGPRKSNIRAIVMEQISSSNEIRFREAGHVFQRTGKIPKSVEILIEKYRASNGDEYFISAEDKEQDILLGFCRLRISKRKEAMIRELHVYGSVANIGEEGEVQHKGLGKKLMAQAESIAKQRHKKEMIVISGVGVREYYRMLGYSLKNRFMWKRL